jgi:hypothetical protein
MSLSVPESSVLFCSSFPPLTFSCLLFAFQNYFDRYGVFTSIVISAPMVVCSFGILVHAVYRAGGMLVQVKRKQLEVQKQQRNTQRQQKHGQPKGNAAAASPAASPGPQLGSRQTDSSTIRDTDVDGEVPPITSGDDSSIKRRNRAAKEDEESKQKER